jgi:predicted cobalt transporter CbtA
VRAAFVFIGIVVVVFEFLPAVPAESLQPRPLVWLSVIAVSAVGLGL